ncbi:aldose 1-epimerase [Novosphingobium olei]|uniref:Aldose 1-epimerase n=1 Tax=Novosphingobium olei TaxID=2728851 RepID=A0A7Y0BLV8_9SPHN|nr:aldose 1-epimerase [Novosphingobium olei]NML92861.1 aldose 1-epimerase [Novosphingobium olei]
MSDADRIELCCSDYGLIAEPSRGGSILAFTWGGQHLLREAKGLGILDAGCFALVPYSNRIGGGQFIWNGRHVTIAPNFPAVDPHNPIHGRGWLSDWTIAGRTPSTLLLEHTYPGGDWPWRYRAALSYALDDDGLTARLALTNLASDPMPAGLGFHPYFPRSDATRYLGLHRGEWQTDSGGLPTKLKVKDGAADWWCGEPVGSRPVDTVYSGREGVLQVIWPDRNLALVIASTPNLSCTAVYVPPDADWFCVEPVSHMTNALNHPASVDAMANLQPGETLEATMRLQARPLRADHPVGARPDG